MPQAEESAELNHSHEGKNHHRPAPCNRLPHHRGVGRRFVGNPAVHDNPEPGAVDGAEFSYFRVAAAQHLETRLRRSGPRKHRHSDHPVRLRPECDRSIGRLADEGGSVPAAIGRQCGFVRTSRSRDGLRQAASWRQFLQPVCHGVSGSAGFHPVDVLFRPEPRVVMRCWHLGNSNWDRAGRMLSWVC